MSLSDIYVQLTQFGHKVEFLGDVDNEYAALKTDGYYIENRIEDSGFRITGKSVFLSVYNGQEVIRFFNPKTEIKNEKSIKEMAKESSNRNDELYKALAEVERKEKEDL